MDNASIKIESGKLNLTGGVTIASTKTLTVEQAAADALKISAINGGTGTLSLAGGTVTQLMGNSSIDQLTMAATAKLDLTTAKLSLAGETLTEINALVASGRAGGLWTGDGISSSSLAGDAAKNLKTLAVLNDGTGVQVLRTWIGDLNGDLKVDGSDYMVLDEAYLSGSQPMLYAYGDVDYSGAINGDDYFRMDQAFLGQSAVLGAGSAGGVAVPEPSTLGVLAIGLLARRRRNRKA